MFKQMCIYFWEGQVLNNYQFSMLLSQVREIRDNFYNNFWAGQFKNHNLTFVTDNMYTDISII